MKQKYKYFLKFIMFIFVLNLFFSVQTRAYGSNNFIDINPLAYYYNAVIEMTKKGYILGYDDNTFRPNNNVTIAESLMLLFRVSGIEIDKISDSTFWYSDIWEMAKRMEIIDDTDNPYDYATRLDIANYIIKLYMLDTSLTYTNYIFEDCNLLVANTMYQYNIFVGVTKEDGRYFLPDNKISRGDFAVVLYRLNEKIQSPYIGTIQYGKYKVHVNPNTVEDFVFLLTYLGETGELSISIPYTKDLSNINYYLKIRDSAITAFEKVFSQYPEYFSFTPTISLKREIISYNSGTIILSVSNENFTTSEIQDMKISFNNTCNNIISNLYITHQIDKNTPTLDKVRIFYKYVIDNCEFDYNSNYESFTGYGASNNKTAVCQGYTALFNNLCRKENIPIKGITGKISSTNIPHMWSAFYDEVIEEWRYCDITFEDTKQNTEFSSNFDYVYFNLDYKTIMVDRILD